MHWKAKAIAQNVIAVLPPPLGDAVYFQLQKHVGALRALDRIHYFEMACRIDSLARTRGRQVEGSFVIEVGTGWDLTLALGLWLGGARKVLSVDLYRHVRPELVWESLLFVRDHPERVQTALGGLTRSREFARRRDHLLAALERPKPFPIPREIEYRAPADAARLDLADGAADLHVSRSVLEHVPTEVLPPLLAEGRRVVGPGGLLLHGVDFTDHFSHGDPNISTIHFLRYSPRSWKRLAGNRFMYQNRLRVDELEHLFRSAGFHVSVLEVDLNSRALRELESGHPLDPRFRGKSAETLATAGAWFLAEAV